MYDRLISLFLGGGGRSHFMCISPCRMCALLCKIVPFWIDESADSTKVKFSRLYVINLFLLHVAKSK